MFNITLNRELSTKLIQKNSLPSTAHESQFRDKQKFHSSPKQRRPVSTEVPSNWPFVVWLQRRASSAWWFTFLSRESRTSWYEIMHLPILGNLPIIGDFPLLRVAEGVGKYNEDWPKVSEEHSDTFLYSSFSVHGMNHFREHRSSHGNKCALSAKVGSVVF